MPTTTPVDQSIDHLQRVAMLGFFRWLERHTDVFVPSVPDVVPGHLDGDLLVNLVDEYIKAQEPTMVCLGCGHHSADHRWSVPTACLADASCGCQSVR